MMSRAAAATCRYAEGQGAKVKGHPPKDGSVLWLKNKGKGQRSKGKINLIV